MKIALTATYIFTLSLCISCSSTKSFRESGYYLSKEDYSKAFKVVAVCGCINEGSKNGLDSFFVKTEDPAIFSEVAMLGHFTALAADSIGRAFSKNIKIIDYADAGFKKPIVSRCMWYGMSEELDKITAERYRILSRSKD